MNEDLLERWRRQWGRGMSSTEWWVEGVIHCPGECCQYFDFDGTPQELQVFISAHQCATAPARED